MALRRRDMASIIPSTGRKAISPLHLVSIWRISYLRARNLFPAIGGCALIANSRLTYRRSNRRTRTLLAGTSMALLAYVPQAL